MVGDGLGGMDMGYGLGIMVMISDMSSVGGGVSGTGVTGAGVSGTVGAGTGGSVSGAVGGATGGNVSGTVGGGTMGVMGTHSSGVGADFAALELLMLDFSALEPLEEEPSLLDLEPLLEMPDALPLLEEEIDIVPAGQTYSTSTHYC